MRRRPSSKSQTGKRRKSALDLTLPGTFTPRFLESADNRLACVREIKARITRLQEQTGADSYQKEILCQHAIFLCIILETMQTQALEGTEELDIGKYTQGVNAIQGILKTLGLDNQALREVANLSEYKKRRGA